MSSSAYEANSTETMGELLDSIDAIKPVRRGDIIEGVVMRADPDGMFVNIGHKAEGIVPPNEMRTLGVDGMLNVGDEVLTFVIKPENADQAAILSIDRAIGERSWHDLSKMVESAETVDGTVAGFNRGGAMVEVQGIQGFVPMSQLVSVSRDRFRGTPPSEPVSAPLTSSEASADVTVSEVEDTPSLPDSPDPDIGKILKLKVIEINRSRNRAIFSERQALQEQRNEQKAQLIKELREGEVRRGKVVGISSFGAFVDLGGADGLIHISELSWIPVTTPEEVVKLGEEIDVFVLRVDAVNKKIALSLRRLQPEPWETIHERFNIGDVVEATVTKLTNFGAFARVDNYVEGLIHISELTNRMINHPKEVVREGESLQVKILRIEPDRRRMGLSLKQLEENIDEPDYGDEE